MSHTGLKHHLWLYYSLSSTNSFLVVQAGHSGPQVLRKMNTSLPCSLILSRQLLNLSVLSCISPTLWMPAPLRQAASSHTTCWAGHRSLTHICFVPIRFPAPCATPQTAFCSQLRFVQLISMHFFLLHSAYKALKSFSEELTKHSVPLGQMTHYSKKTPILKANIQFIEQSKCSPK